VLGLALLRAIPSVSTRDRRESAPAASWQSPCFGCIPRHGFRVEPRPATWYRIGQPRGAVSFASCRQHLGQPRITIRSSRSCFAARLNSGVRRCCSKFIAVHAASARPSAAFRVGSGHLSCRRYRLRAAPLYRNDGQASGYSPLPAASATPRIRPSGAGPPAALKRPVR